MSRLTFAATISLVALSAVLGMAAPVRAGCTPSVLSNDSNTCIGTNALSKSNDIASFNNTAVGFNALSKGIVGWDNTATGYLSLANNNYGFHNTANGSEALTANTSGHHNTASGSYALRDNTFGSENSALGFGALHKNLTGRHNTAVGSIALFENSTGEYNTVVGSGALEYNKFGNKNTIVGANAAWRLNKSADSNNSSSNNVALGFEAGSDWDKGSNNIAIGDSGRYDDNNVIRIGSRGVQTATFIAGIWGKKIVDGQTVVIDENGQLGVGTAPGGLPVIPGAKNTGVGSGALTSNTADGINNTASGFDALKSNTGGDNNTAYGVEAMLNANGSGNTALGYEAGMNWTSGSNNIAIGSRGISSDTKTIRIGVQGIQDTAFIAGIYGNRSERGQPVLINDDGELGAPMILGSENIALGSGALANNTADGHFNTANGGIALLFNTVGKYNTGFGYAALFRNDSGSYNTAIGSAAGGALVGNYNTSIGAKAAYGVDSSGDRIDKSGDYNMAIGYEAGSQWTSGSNNIAIGNAGAAADSNTIRIGSGQTRAFMAGILGNPIGGGQTVVIGADGQLGVAPAAAPVPGENITMIGTGALASNQAGGNNNTAAGMNALNQNTTGGNNTASGMNALNRNSTGGSNTASGVAALQQNTTGNNNTASGVSALFSNVSGGNNTAIGHSAMFNNTGGSNNTALGFGAGNAWTTGSNNIAIGHAGAAGESNTIRIGGAQSRTFVAGIFATKSAKGSRPVLVDANGQLGTSRSSLRYKEDVHTMGDASNALMDLRPVTYRYKQAEADGSKPVQYGLIAEEVDKVMPDLVVYDELGRPDSVSYEILPSLLLNEYQKQSRELAATKAELAVSNNRLQQLEASHSAKIDAMAAELTALKLAVSRLAAAPSAVKVAASEP
jgi:hypothetical protein